MNEAGRMGEALPSLIALATRVLGWRPQEFWAATPAELAAALGAMSPATADPGIDRQTLAQLMEREHER